MLFSVTSAFCHVFQCDLIDDGEKDVEITGPVISKEIMDEYSKKFGFIDWFLTSAKDNINLDTGTRRLVEKVCN